MRSRRPGDIGRPLAGGVLAAVCVAACGAGATTTTVTRAAPRAGGRQAVTRAGAPSRAGAGAASGPRAATGARTASGTTAAAVAARRSAAAPAPYPRLLTGALGTQPTGFVPVSSSNGQVAAWVARSSSGVSLLSFNQSVLELHLHSGTSDAGPTGWRFGPAVAGQEARQLVAAFNGGFKFATGSGGFESYGRVAVGLRAGLGSIVTYADGRTDIAAWGSGVPASGQRVVSVRQNLALLIDHGRAASDLGCLPCWGATLGGVDDPARSALGITADGRLIWAAGEHLTVAALAGALLGAHVVRAVQLDINPYWVAGYLYGHRGGRGPLAPVAVVAGQSGIPGEYLTPWSRDFFTVVVR